MALDASPEEAKFEHVCKEPSEIHRVCPCAAQTELVQYTLVVVVVGLVRVDGRSAYDDVREELERSR